MIQTKEKEIDGRKISVTQFPARRGLALKTKLITLFGPALFSIISSFSGVKSVKDLMDSDIDLNNIGQILDKLFQKVSSSILEELIFELLASTRLDNQEITSAVFDLEFAGNYGTLYKILGFVLEVNYGSFLALSNIGNLSKKVM
jgi:hypothetical protein